MNTRVLLGLLLISGFSYGQGIKFKDITLENGFTYPEVIAKDTSVQNKMNRSIEAKVAYLKESEMCVGQYGYTQKNDFIQLGIHASCFEYPKIQNVEGLYSIRTGEEVQVSAMFDPNRLEKFKALFEEKLTEFMESNGVDLESESSKKILTQSIDDLRVRLAPEGLHFSPKDESWNKKELFFSWTSLDQYLIKKLI